ncbi:hypothetical protein PG593_03700 [Riemerella anatipestifer]|nr:hypothetical protein [Riemerella anatipestifer]MCU7559116.1 hypothetical protein [Riemerella anatipestifer]MDY3400688.1 hypothetical protein [Riemerella anatipestifer]MDY3528884.1 hypothetical protein [Riemerella anatipestifer]MDY3538256.1 hypothetical protein [Riemerella anatipestifer]
MKNQFEKVKMLAKKHKEESSKLDRMINEFYGFNYSETDDDQIIDTLDYGTNSVSFKEFERRMNEYKEDFEKGKKFRCIP